MTTNRDQFTSEMTGSTRRDEAREETARQIVAAYLVRLKVLVRAVLNQQIRRKDGTTAVVQDAFASFFARDPDLSDLDGVWPLLAAITRHKALHTARRYTSQRRSVIRERSVPRSIAELSSLEFWEQQIISREPGPADAMVLIEVIQSLADDHEQLLGRLLQGATKAQLATEFHCSERNVERMIESLRENLLKQLQ